MKNQALIYSGLLVKRARTKEGIELDDKHTLVINRFEYSLTIN